MVFKTKVLNILAHPYLPRNQQLAAISWEQLANVQPFAALSSDALPNSFGLVHFAHNRPSKCDKLRVCRGELLISSRCFPFAPGIFQRVARLRAPLRIFEIESGRLPAECWIGMLCDDLSGFKFRTS
jgi:hypothetical protein